LGLESDHSALADDDEVVFGPVVEVDEAAGEDKGLSG
jgi:hypothetical protein